MIHLSGAGSFSEGWADLLIIPDGVYNILLGCRTETSEPIKCWLLMAGHTRLLLDTRPQDSESLREATSVFFTF